jgi:hypothetical protein
MWTRRAQQVDNPELHPATKTTSVQDVVNRHGVVSEDSPTQQGIA